DRRSSNALCDDLRCTLGEQAISGELGGLSDEALAVAAGDLDVDVGDTHVDSGQREGLGDSATHVTATDDGVNGAFLVAHNFVSLKRLVQASTLSGNSERR